MYCIYDILNIHYHVYYVVYIVFFHIYICGISSYSHEPNLKPMKFIPYSHSQCCENLQRLSEWESWRLFFDLYLVIYVGHYCRPKNSQTYHQTDKLTILFDCKSLKNGKRSGYSEMEI